MTGKHKAISTAYTVQLFSFNAFLYTYNELYGYMFCHIVKSMYQYI